MQETSGSDHHFRFLCNNEWFAVLEFFGCDCMVRTVLSDGTIRFLLHVADRSCTAFLGIPRGITKLSISPSLSLSADNTTV